MAFYNESVGKGIFDFGVGGSTDALSYYADGYRRAADHLAKSLLRRGGFLNCEAYPVVFLYQHAFELSLKHAIYKAAEYAHYTNSRDFDDRLHNDHNLRRLSQIATASLMRLFPELDLKELLVRISDTSRELAELDALGYGCRYPIDTKGSPAGETSGAVNLRLFSRHMSSLLEDMDTLNVCLDNLTDAAQDAFTEWFQSLSY